MKYSICLLCFEDSPELAAQALGSILRTAEWSLVQDIRIGLNAVSPATRTVIHDLCCSAAPRAAPIYVVRESDNANVGKYPMMRRLFYGLPEAPLAPAVMWFDDDTYICAEPRAWWHKVDRLMGTSDLLGGGRRIRLRPAQLAGINAQPWCVRKLSSPEFVHFVTGGWWVARSHLLRRWNYPFPELYHNGGDSILGLLARQQQWRVTNYQTGVLINAGFSGKHDGAKRRGLVSPWPWQISSPQPPNGFTTFIDVYEAAKDGVCSEQPLSGTT